MLVYNSKLLNTPILSFQSGSPIGYIVESIVDPNSLKIIAFRLAGPLLSKTNANILDVSSVREYSDLGLIIDDIDELIGPDDVVKIKEILDLNFSLIDLKVETRKGAKLGKVIDYTVTKEDFTVQQLVVHRPIIKSLIDPELLIPRNEIVEITDYKVIIKDEEKTLKKKAEKENFIPNFVNPFRNPEQGYAPSQTENPDELNTK